MRSRRLASSLVCLAAIGSGAQVSAAPQLRQQVDQKGDFVLFGNTLAHECAQGGTPAVPAPVVGTSTCGGGSVVDTSPDVLWSSDQPAAGQALANAGVSVAQARSSAVLELPAGATVTYARIYWAGYLASGAADTNVRIERVATGLNTLVSADATFESPVAGAIWYQSTADVTALVRAQGPGVFRVSDVSSITLAGTNSEDPFLAWSMVVFYELASEPSRNLALFDGFDQVAMGAPQSATLTGFLVPNAGFDAKLGVVAYEGEAQITGDALVFNGTTLTDAVNPAANFFNSSRSLFGQPISIAGDLPQLTGGPRSMSGVDLDVVDVTAEVGPGDTSATISATSNQDRYLLGVFVTSISTFNPNFESSNKTFVDVNGGAIRPGDEIEYTINVVNTGNDSSVDTVLNDALPLGASFVPGSIQISSGPNAGSKTDVASDDQAEFLAGSRTLRVRLGTGANAITGGALAVGQATSVKFRVSVDANAGGTISNQAIVTSSGQRGAPPTDFPTDGNGSGPGTPPTDFPIDECASDAECTNPARPHCNVATNPNTCVECVTNLQCTDPARPDCNPTSNVCECASGTGTCVDSDGDGLSDGLEGQIGTNPNDADTDDDGVIDGQEPSPGTDSDGDLVINALDPDSDNDGLFDGTELGRNCSNPATDLSKGDCRPDADTASVTDPLDPDSDNGGVSDGSEDSNLDGRQAGAETDPTSGNAADDAGISDGDADGLSDALEATLRSNPNDADTDDDGLRDGEEANPSSDTDDDGLINVLDVDSDDDALYDGTELGKACDDPATDNNRNHCRADNDGGATKTSPIDADTDNGGARDGSEDVNLNGIVDSGERDPTPGHGADDSGIPDSDGDGLSDGLEGTLGSSPNDADSDDDGALDGEEHNPSDDTDGDGARNVLDVDSDADGLFDGTEVGNGCSNPATDVSRQSCIADGDAGATTTSSVDVDTDDGSVPDGTEDTDRDGVVDPGERDPNDPSDDLLPDAGVDGSAGTDGGAGTGGETDGSVDGGAGAGGETDASLDGGAGADGETDASVDGGAGADGETDASVDGSADAADAAPDGDSSLDGGADAEGGLSDASSGDASDGRAGAAGSAGAGGSAGSAGTGGLSAEDTGVIEGGGCSCSTPASQGGSTSLLAMFGLAIAWILRRSRPRPRLK